MRAFHGDPAVKKKYLTRVEAHRIADEITNGQYWENGKGCAVGCTIHGSDHESYEPELGLPEWVAHVEDVLFEGMSPIKAKYWPGDFLGAIPEGSDIDSIKSKFIVIVLRKSMESLDNLQFDRVKFPQVESAIIRSMAAIEQMISAHNNEDLAARSAAESAARSAAVYDYFADELLKLLKEAPISEEE